MATAYDSVRYPGSVYTQTDPAALGVIAKLFGLPFAPFKSCRMLEIGCGDGVNLINLALSAPGSRFLGVDLAQTAIANAKADAAACGLTNVEFIAADLRDIDASFGSFDYVVAHGVLSWVPKPIASALIRVIGERLAPGGIAMVSFVALPGGRTLQVIRDLLTYETRDATSPEDKLSRSVAALESFIGLWSAKGADTAYMIDAARRTLARAPGALFHDELSECYEPQLIADVAVAASKSGLLYLADARPRAIAEALFPSESAAYARVRAGGDWARFQQYLDFQDMRSFHNSVFVKGGAPDRRRCASRLEGLWIQCDLREVECESVKSDEVVFMTGEGVRLSTNDPSLAALFRGLANAYPEALPLSDVPDLVAVADHVFKLYTSQVARVSTAPSRARREAGQRPLASALACRQAARGERDLATLMQTVARMESDPLITLVTLLDGTRVRADLALPWAAMAGVDAAEASVVLDGALTVLARAGLLMATVG
jgi:SAM-dependent methyltransferase